MKKQFKIGDLIMGGFPQALAYDYGFGIIIQKKTFGPSVNAYRIYWSNYHPTWEPARQLTLVAKAK
jgi:hypothetical protein